MDNLCGHFDLVFLCEKSKLGKEFYCLHNHAMLDELKEEWAQMGKWTSWDIPVDKIRNYYGEKIALYYVWLQNYTQWLIVPAIAGIFAFILQKVVGTEIDHTATINTPALVSTFFSFIVAMWCSVFCEFWGRKQSQYAVSWGTKDFLEIEPPRPDFEGDKELNPVTEKYERMYPSWRRNSKLVFSFFSMIVMVCIVVTIVFILLSYRGQWTRENKKGLVYLAAGLNSVQIKIFNVIYGMLATTLNNWENHRTETEYEDALIVKIFLFQFVNSYNSFFFLAFYKPISWGTTCADESSKFYGTAACDFMGQLAIQLGIIFCVGVCMNAVELGVPYIKQKMEMKKEKEAVIANADKYERVYMYPAEFESKLAEYDGTMGDYLEMVIQYGFVTLFCAGFPLTPLLAFLNNMAEMRVDAVKLCYMTHKPYPAATEDIGTWEGIMRAVSIVAVITNIGIILFTAKLFPSADLSTQLMVFILLEHIMFAVKVFIDQVIPDVSAQTDELMERHKVVIDKYINEVDDDGVGDIKKTGQIIDEKFLKQIDTHDETIRKQL